MDLTKFNEQRSQLIYDDDRIKKLINYAQKHDLKQKLEELTEVQKFAEVKQQAESIFNELKDIDPELQLKAIFPRLAGLQDVLSTINVLTLQSHEQQYLSLLKDQINLVMPYKDWQRPTNQTDLPDQESPKDQKKITTKKPRKIVIEINPAISEYLKKNCKTEEAKQLSSTAVWEKNKFDLIIANGIRKCEEKFARDLRFDGIYAILLGGLSTSYWFTNISNQPLFLWSEIFAGISISCHYICRLIDHYELWNEKRFLKKIQKVFAEKFAKKIE
jgi:hypothetical protein